MDKLTGYEIQIDTDRNKILVVKSPEANHDDGEDLILAIEIRAAKPDGLAAIKAGLASGTETTFDAIVTI
jgi:hypothetical protein